jgi:hypothetical protein
VSTVIRVDRACILSPVQEIDSQWTRWNNAIRSRFRAYTDWFGEALRAPVPRSLTTSEPYLGEDVEIKHSPTAFRVHNGIAIADSRVEAVAVLRWRVGVYALRACASC